MKKLLSIALILALTLGLAPAVAAQAVTPTPPPWCPEEEYAVFPGSAAYEPENWELIEQTREQLRWGEDNVGALARRWDFFAMPDAMSVDGVKRDDFGVLFERTLVEARLLYTHDDYNGPYWPSLMYELEGGGDQRLSGLTDQQRYAILLWTARGILRYQGVGEELDEYLPYLADFPQFNMDKLVDTPIFDDQRREQLRSELEGHIRVWLDGQALKLDVPPEVKNQRTMVPVRAVAEAIGADVKWVQEKQQVVMTRAGSTVTMTLDSTTAIVDGKAVEMDVAPYATNGRTLLPARYVAEFFGQKVEWDGEKRQVLITEDKSVAGDSNLEAWALPMGAMLNDINSAAPQRFGDGAARSKARADHARGILNGGQWNVFDRGSLVETIWSMTLYGHDATFREMAADVKLRTPEERAQISGASNTWPAYMWEYTEYLDQKWGDKGIMAWDLFRMSNLAQWGYSAGYLTYEEALAMLTPAASILAVSFSSWDEAYENYLDGYNWWARNNVVGQDIWQTERGKRYQAMKQAPETAPIFDDTLFQTGVISLPE